MRDIVMSNDVSMTHMPEKFINFSSTIRSLCVEKSMEYIEAVVHWCELHDVEVELAALLIEKDPLMKSMIQTEAEDLNYLKKTAKLPV
jgi:hypothetical protein